MSVRTWRRKATVALSALALAAAASFGTVVVSAEPAAAAGKCVNYNYSYGGYSSCVGNIQRLLNFYKWTGFSTLTVDNSFGSKTRDAVRKVQSRYGLKVDGIVGPRTWSLICHPQAGPGPVPGFPYAAARAAGC